MASQAFKDAVNGAPTTQQGVLDQIAEAIRLQQMYSSQNYNGMNYELSKAATLEGQKQTQLKYLLNAVNSSGSWGAGGSGSGGGSSVNPFSGGGAAGSSGAPTVSTDNRFAAGLTDAESRLRALLDDPSSIKNTAAYNFRFNQGQEALQRSLGAKGMLNSGNRLMELTKYGQDMASQEYDNQYGRLGNLLGNYSTGYVADKNANTNLFGAQSTAWNQAQANNDRTRLGFADIAAQNSRAATTSSGGGFRSTGINSGFDRGLYGYGQSASDAWNDVYANDARRIQNEAAQYSLDRLKNADRGY